ncbi:uncharacterized protein LOC106397460 [Brassica napus]|uniref:Uncharacterized protein n=2 Tax=Brassica TaxID=3705 RepID=A0A3P6DZJ2_BRAOL|nr:uncharacterized protein LOC106397460 [Brassica napus]CAF1919794.1 unnamed protein product [Brassica napus]VDD25762.1 unnamed protein product [Brassica oleracea]
MNVQAHMSGQQRSRQSPNQGNNGNSQMQNLVAASAGAGGSVGPSRSTVGLMDHDILKLRQYMQILVNGNHLRLMLHQMMYSVSTVVLFTLAMAAATGLGAVPFFFVKLDLQWAGICNGMAAGVMLAASFDLVNMLCITGCICDEV